MFNGTAKAALSIASKTSAELAQHVVICNEYHRDAAVQRAVTQSAISALGRDLSDARTGLQAQVVELRHYISRTVWSVGGAAFLLVLSALGALTMFILEHIDKLAK